MAFEDVNRSLQSDPTYQAALRGEGGTDQFPTGPDGRVLEGFRTVAARYYAETKASGGTRNQDAVNQMYQGSKGSTINPESGEWSDPNATHWYDPQYLGPAVIGAIATGGIASAAMGGGAVAGGAGAGSAVPGSAAAQALVPATLGGFTTPGVGMAATTTGLGTAAGGTSLAARMGRGLANAAPDLGKAALIAGPALAGRAMRGSGGSGSGNASLPPELQQLLQMSLKRMASQDPLFSSINAQAMAGLPTAYQRS